MVISASSDVFNPFLLSRDLLHTEPPHLLFNPFVVPFSDNVLKD